MHALCAAGLMPSPGPPLHRRMSLARSLACQHVRGALGGHRGSHQGTAPAGAHLCSCRGGFLKGVVQRGEGQVVQDLWQGLCAVAGARPVCAGFVNPAANTRKALSRPSSRVICCNVVQVLKVTWQDYCQSMPCHGVIGNVLYTGHWEAGARQGESRCIGGFYRSIHYAVHTAAARAGCIVPLIAP